MVTVDADHAGCSETPQYVHWGHPSQLSCSGRVVDHAVYGGFLQRRERVGGDCEGHRDESFHKELVQRWCISEVVVGSDSSAGRGMVSRLGVGRRSKHLETKSLFAQHLIKYGLVGLERVHTKVNTADIDTKYFDAPTMRRLV